MVTGGKFRLMQAAGFLRDLAQVFAYCAALEILDKSHDGTDTAEFAYSSMTDIEG